MDAFINFFAVRPVFAPYGIRILSAAYVIDQALPFFTLLGNPKLIDRIHPCHSRSFLSRLPRALQHFDC